MTDYRELARRIKLELMYPASREHSPIAEEVADVIADIRAKVEELRDRITALEADVAKRDAKIKELKGKYKAHVAYVASLYGQGGTVTDARLAPIDAGEKK